MDVEPFPDAAILFLGRDGDYRLAADPFATAPAAEPEQRLLLPAEVAGRSVVSSSIAQWSPDGRQVAAAVQLEENGRRPEQTVIVLVTPDTGTTEVVWRDEAAVPFVLGWGPEGRRVAVLATGADSGLLLEVLHLTTADTPADHESGTLARRVELEQTAPIYFDWTADGSMLVANSGGNTFVYDVETGERTALSAAGGTFRAPDAGFAGDGTLAVERRSGRQSIVELVGGGRRLDHIDAPAGAAFAWRPGGRYVAALRFTGVGLIGALSVVDTGDVVRQVSWSGSWNSVPVSEQFAELANTPAFAMEWAPDGSGLLVVGPDFSVRQRYAGMWRWAAPDRNGVWHLRELFQAQPEPAYVATRLPFFDQYLRVGSTIAPDGSAFVYGREIEGSGGRSEVRAYRLADGAHLTVGPGSFPTWRPAPPVR